MTKRQFTLRLFAIVANSSMAGAVIGTAAGYAVYGIIMDRSEVPSIAPNLFQFLASVGVGLLLGCIAYGLTAWKISQPILGTRYASTLRNFIMSAPALIVALFALNTVAQALFNLGLPLPAIAFPS